MSQTWKTTMTISQYKTILERAKETMIDRWYEHNMGNSCHNDFMDYLYQYMDSFLTTVNYFKQYRTLQTTLFNRKSKSAYDSNTWSVFLGIINGFIEVTSSVTDVEKRQIPHKKNENLRCYTAIVGSDLNKIGPSFTIQFAERYGNEERVIVLDKTRILRDLEDYPKRSIYRELVAETSQIFRDVKFYIENYCHNDLH
jgi:hypothetical protein